MPLDMSILNALRRGQVIAAEVQASSPNYRAWVAVYPLEPADGGYKYRVRKFEVAEQYLVDDNDVWEGTMEHKEDHYVRGEDDLTKVLDQYPCGSEGLTSTWKCDYPV